MQLLPAAAAEAANPAGGGSDGKRNQQHERGEADGDITALGDVLPHLREIEKFIQPDVGGEVQARVEKGKQAEHTAETDQIGEAQDFAQRGDGQSEQEEAQRPVAGGVGDELDGIGGEIVMQGPPSQ